nr:hypothetical protein [Burkholderia diffusa]
MDEKLAVREAENALRADFEFSTTAIQADALLGSQVYPVSYAHQFKYLLRDDLDVVACAATRTSPDAATSLIPSLWTNSENASAYKLYS